jgi:hypothetical protein
MSRMMQRAAVGTAALALVLGTAATASAQVVHSIGFGAGGFAPRTCPQGVGENVRACWDARGRHDVLVENLAIGDFDGEGRLAFDLKDFRGLQAFGEWNVTFNDRVEVSLGAGFYRKTVPSLYANLINTGGAEIEQDLRLQVVPLSAVVRFLPIGRAGQLQPYVGGGLSALRWRYSETGEFVDLFDYSVFQDQYLARGTTLAPVVLGGLRLPLGGDVYALNTEFRYQFGSGDLGANSGFLTEKIDLSGLNFTVGFQIRF